MEASLQVHLVDGTYELFRHYYALPSARDQDGYEVAAVRGVLTSMLGMIRDGATHVAIATDHVIESFRNGLWPGYKTGEGIEPDLLAQFPLLEDTLVAAGLVVWPMVEFEADDALASAAVAAARDPRVDRVMIGKFGVSPASIPDYLALVGDAADGYPGLPGWGAKSTAAVLVKFAHIEFIPTEWREWRVNVANPSALARTLSQERDRALLFRTLATLRTDIALFDDVEQLRWSGPKPGFPGFAARLDPAATEVKQQPRRRST
jgi:5'-3' exonuclease